jgi:hypothetical protein
MFTFPPLLPPHQTCRKEKLNMNAKPLSIAVALLLAVSGLAQSASADDKTAHEDALLIAAQKTCPISGDALGKMGAPVKTKIGEQTVFLCCKACIGKEPSAENRQKLTANLIAAQGTCPVEGTPLPKDAPSAVVNNRQIFACSTDSLTKIKADPAKYIAKVDELLEKNLKDQAAKKM